jgi:DNA polymerase
VAVKTGDAEALRPWSDPEQPFRPLDILSSALRLAIVAREGAQLGIGDFSMIEACVLLALSGQKDKCALIADGADIYRDMAAAIYGLDRETFLAIPQEELTIEQSEQRRIGKCTILGAGFGMGVDTFRERYLKHLPADEAQHFAKQVLATYRTAWAPSVPRLWSDLEHTAARALTHQGMRAVAACGISYRLDRRANLPMLVCTLPNGKAIFYPDARISEIPGKHGEIVWNYRTYRPGQQKRGRRVPGTPDAIEPWGGMLCENVVSAIARELLCAAMLRFEARGFPIVLTVHDEIVVESPGLTEVIIKEIMGERPDWAERLGIPVRVKAWTGRRYGK